MRTTSRRLLAALAGALVIMGGSVAAPFTAAAAPASLPAAALPPAAVPAFESAAPPAARPAGAALAALVAARPPKVTVPSNYVYNPKRGSRHDYCTFAPDEFPAPHAANADFRGPCARHDLCYDAKTSKKSCDKALRNMMFQNCEYYYGRFNPLRSACKTAAVIYWTAVIAA
jgi:hypothetical protein